MGKLEIDDNVSSVSTTQEMPASPQVYRVGTLVYSRTGLLALFGWLLWGDFVFTLMESVSSVFLPILKSYNATNSQMAFILGTMGAGINAVMNPIISYRSDRYRSRFGRRRPFILFSTPFLVLFLMAIPFTPEITALLQAVPALKRLSDHSPIPPLVFIFAVLLLGFQIFNMFICTIYYYLIPDVVPNEVIGRFTSLFRVCGTFAGMLFQFFLFGHATQNARFIFVALALVYGVFIMLMCWRVKEGEYPPAADSKQQSWFSGIKTYTRECFSSVTNLWMFLAYSVAGWGGSVSMFTYCFLHDELLLSDDFIGRLNAITSALVIILAYPFGALLDRWGSYRTLLLAMLIQMSGAVGMFYLAHGQWSIVVWQVIRSAAFSLYVLGISKWTVEVYPREKFGQFASAAAMFASVGGMLLTPLGGMWIDWTANYRFLLVWNAAFVGFGLFAIMVFHYRRKSSRAGSTQN